MIMIILMITCMLSTKSSLCDDEYRIENNSEVAIGETSFPLMENVAAAGTSSSEPEFMNRRLLRDYQVGTSKTYEHNQGRRNGRHMQQVYLKKSAGVAKGRRSNASFGDKEISMFDRYEGVFGHCDGRGKRVIRN
eukprot:XP_016661728.1 PREDICTED: uncharacterized protein LOC107884366 [Acyrthosiphon pisum]